MGSHPDGVIQVGSLVYVANLTSGTISVVDPSTATVTGTIALSGTSPEPSEMASSPERDALYVNNVRDGTTEVVDLNASPPAVEPTVATVGTYPAYIAVHGTTGYVANASAQAGTPGSISVLNLADKTNPVVTATVSVGAHPYGIADVPSLGEVLAANSGDDNMYVIDRTTNAVVGTVAVGLTPDAVAVTPDQTTAVVSEEGTGVTAGDVRILHINQAPTVSVPSTTQHVHANGNDDDQTLTFSAATGNALSASDPDADDRLVQATVSVSHGTLTLGGTSGLDVTDNDGATVTFTGTLTSVNDALDGLTYQPTSGYQGSDTLTVSVNDQGASGDIGKPETGTGTAAISVDDVAPAASNISFAGAVGNTTFGVGTSPPQPSTTTTGTVLDTSSDSDGDTITAVPGTIATAHSGSVALNANGSFTYAPPPDFTGNSDSFPFQVSDGVTTSSATATINIGGMVWYVKNNDTGTNDGRSTSPFQTLGQAQNASAGGDSIFVFKGDGTTTGQDSGIALQSNQALVGEADDLVVGTRTVFTGNSSNRPDIGNSSGSGVMLAPSNTVEGLNIASHDSGAAISGDASATSGGTIHDDVVSGIYGAGGISLIGTGGTWNISGLSDSVTWGGPGLKVTGPGPGTGATVNVTGSSNTLSTDTGDALDLENTAVGASNITFQSISAGTSTGGPADGIYLRNTGSGSLIVTGTGTTAGSGGTVQRATATPAATSDEFVGNVSARNAGPISLSNMNLHTPVYHNVAAAEVPSLTLINNDLTGTANGGGILYQLGYGSRLGGRFDIANNTINGVFNDYPIHLFFATSADVSGHVTGNTLGTSGNTTNSNGGGIKIDSEDGKVDADVSNNHVYGTYQDSGIIGDTNGFSASNPTLNLNLTNNTIDDESTHALDAVNVGASSTDDSGTSTVCLTFTGNTATSKGTSPNNGALYDATGAYLHNDWDYTVFEIAGGPNENVGGFGEDPLADAYIQGVNTLSGPGGGDPNSLAVQMGTAGFVPSSGTPSSCEQAPAAQLTPAAATTQRLSTTTASQGTPTKAAGSVSRHVTGKAKALTAKQLQRLALRKRKALRAEVRARVRALRRELMARQRRSAARAHHHHHRTKQG